MIEDFTLGSVPAPNPLEVELFRPAQEEQDREYAAYQQAQADHQKAIAQWQEGAVANAYSAATDWDGFAQGKEIPLDDAPNPDEAKASIVTGLYLDALNKGEPMGGGDLGRAMRRDEIAHTRFAGRGSGSDMAFAAEVAREAKDTKDERELLSGTPRASKDTLIGRVTDAAVAGQDWQATFLDWQKSAATDPRFKPDRLPAYEAAAKSAFDQISNQVEQAKPYAQGIFSKLTFERDTQSFTYGGGDLMDSLMQVPKDLRPIVISLVSRDATKEGEQQEAGGHALNVVGRGFMHSLFRGQSNQDATAIINMDRILSQLKPGDEFPGNAPDLYTAVALAGLSGSSGADDLRIRVTKGMDRLTGVQLPRVTAEDIAAAREKVALDQERFQLQKQIEQIGEGQLDPLKPSGWFQSHVTYPALSGVVPPLATFMLARGVAGTPGAVAAMAPFREMMTNDFAQNYLTRNPSMTFAQAYDLGEKSSNIATGIQFATDMLTLGSTGPLLGNALKNAEAPLLQTFAKGLATNAAVQNGMMAVQDITPYVVQSLDQTAPGQNWSEVLYGEHGFWRQRADTFFSLLPVVIFSAGHGVVAAKASLPELRRAAAALENETMLKAAGIGEEGRARIAAESDPVAKMNRFSEELKSPDEKVGAEGQAELEAQQAKARQAEDEARRAGIIPTFIHTADGIEVRDTATGESVGTAADAEGAMTLARNHYEAVKELDANRTAAMASMLEANQLTTGTDSPMRQTKSEFSPGERRTPVMEAAESPVDEARIMDELQSDELLHGGDGEISKIVTGKSVTEFKEGQRRTLNRLFGGSTVLQVFHEEAHGFFREAIATGRLTVDEATEYIRSLQDAYSGSRALKLIPQEGEVTMGQLEEAVGHLFEAEILRNRDGGTKRTEPGREGGLRGIPSAIITKNLTATAKTAPEATRKFSAFVNAVRRFFGAAFRRAIAIDKAIREGKIDQAKHDEFISKLLGLDGQDTHNAEALRHADEILGGGAFEGDPFALSPAAMADALIGDASKQIKKPKERIGFFSRMVEKLGDLRRETDQVASAFGKDYVRKAVVDPNTAERIRRENGIWQAFRRDELENLAQAKHMGILSNEDLTKLSAQPVHSELSTSNPLRGRLRSPSKAEARMEAMGQTELIHGGDYDGSEGVSRSVFGGDLAPDQAAQELFEAGLIREPTTDALWNALKRESDSVANMKRYRKAAEDDLRKARTQAKKEAAARIKKAMDEQKRDYSTKARLLRSMAMLDGIMASLPPEIRGKLGGYTKLAKLGSDEKRLEFLQGRVSKAGELVEQWVKKEQRADLDKLLERAKPNKNAPGESKRGKIGADAHRLFAWADDAVNLTPDQADAARLSIEKEQERIAQESVPGVVHPEALELANRARVLDAIGAFDEMSPEDQSAGLSWLQNVYDFGRDEWQAKESGRLAEVAGLQRKMLESLAGQIGVSLPKFEAPEFDRSSLVGKSPSEAEALMRKFDSRLRNAMTVHKEELRKALEVGGVGSLSARQKRAAADASKEVRSLLEGGSGELISFVQVLERVLPENHELVKRWNEAVGKAQNQKTDSILAADRAWNAAAAAAMPKKGLIDRKTRLWEMSAEQTVSFQKRASGRPLEIEVPLSDVDGLLDGSIAPTDYSLRAEDLPAVQAALDEHDARPDEGKGAAGKKAVKFLTVERGTEGQPVQTKLSEMQAITLLLVSRQERYRSNLEAHGFDPFEIENVRSQLSPEGSQMMEWMASFYRDNYEPLAGVFRDMFGVDLPRESNYSPFRAEKGGVDRPAGPDDMLADGGFRAGFTKSRAPKHNLAPDLQNAVTVFQGHVAESEHWRAFAPLVRELKAVLQNLDVSHAIESIHGEKIVSILNGWIQAFEQNGLKQRQKFDGSNALIRRMQRNIAVMGLAFRASSLIKNAILPALNTARRIGVRNWALGMTRFATGKLDYGRFVHADFITRREASGFSPELRTAVAKLRSEKPTRTKEVAEWSMRLLGVADARSTAVGAAVAWDFHYRENLRHMSHEEADALAIRQAEDDVRRTAQPVELAEKSLYELSQSDVGRLLFMFASEARKDYAGVQESVRQAWKKNGVKGLLTDSQFRTTAATIWLSAGLASTIISHALSDLFDDGKDEDVFDDKNWNPGAILASTLLGPLGGLPMVGNIGAGFDRSVVSKAYQGIDAAKQIFKGNIPDENRVDWLEKQSKKILDGVGMFSKAAAEISAVSNIIDQAYRAVRNRPR